MWKISMTKSSPVTLGQTKIDVENHPFFAAHPRTSSVQNPSIIPFNPGWLMGIPRSWIIIIPNI